ncbi:MAG: hypothetical protein P8X95_23980, partial [Anaerolineales bacterium]
MFQKQSFIPNVYAPILLVFAALAVGMLIIAIIPILQPAQVSRYADAVPAVSGFDQERVNAAYTARLNGLAGQTVNMYGSTAWIKAPHLSRAQAAEAARLTGLAGQSVNMYGSTNWVRASNPGLSRAQAAEAARLTGIAGQSVNMFGSTAWVSAPHLSRAQAAEAARLTG